LSGPIKEYPYYLGVRLSEEVGAKIDAVCKKRRLSRSEWLRRELETLVDGVRPKARPKKDPNRGRDIDAVEIEYNHARQTYFTEFRGRKAPGEVKFTKKRRKAASEALDIYTLEVVRAAMRGIFLDEFFVDRGLISPDYALKPKNVERFSNIVFDLRAEKKRRTG
jgi:hypothetical protein